MMIVLTWNYLNATCEFFGALFAAANFFALARTPEPPRGVLVSAFLFHTIWAAISVVYYTVHEDFWSAAFAAPRCTFVGAWLLLATWRKAVNLRLS